jgi:hypothetical protein
MKWSLNLALVVLLSLPTVAAADEPLRRVLLDDVEGPHLARQLEREGFDVLMGSVTPTSVEVVVTPEDLAVLKHRGFDPVVLEVGRPLVEIFGEYNPLDALPTGYPTVGDVENHLLTTAATYPSICQAVNLTFTYGMPTTYEGRNIWAVKISDNVTQDEDEPAFLLVSCHHAREIATIVAAQYAIDQFTSQYGIDPTITALVDDYEIWISPLWNPDGYNECYYGDNMWRKNRRVFASGTGVDLNRNYPFGWDNPCSGSTTPSSITYKGPEAGSESETKTMMAFSNDRHFSKVIDYHNSGQEVLHGYACWSHPFDSFFTQEAIALSYACGYNGDHRGPSADGEHYQWQLAMFGNISYLIETHTSFQPSYASAVAEATQLFPGTLFLMQRPVPLSGHVTDAVSGAPISATIEVTNVSFPNGESNESGGPFGRYYFWAPSGTYNLQVTAPNYDPLTITGVTVDAVAGTVLDIQMSPGPDVITPNGGETLYQGVQTTIDWNGSNPAVQYQVQETSNYGEIGTLSESFESGTLDPMFTTGGAAPWYVTPTFPLMGQYACRAGNISHNQTSWMTLTVGGGDVSFWYLCNSELNGDYFNFYIDGNRVVHASGYTGWSSYSTTLTAGTHELKWEYAKDASGTAGNDSVWIDFLEVETDLTAWNDVITLTAPGVTTTPWTPATISDDCKIRVRTFYPSGGYYGAWGESDNLFSVVAAPVGCIGDADCDFARTFNDIQYFVAGLTGEQAWIDYHVAQTGGGPSCPFTNLDIDGMNGVTFEDIQPFVNLIGVPCP